MCADLSSQLGYGKSMLVVQWYDMKQKFSNVQLALLTTITSKPCHTPCYTMCYIMLHTVLHTISYIVIHIMSHCGTHHVTHCVIHHVTHCVTHHVTCVTHHVTQCVTHHVSHCITHHVTHQYHITLLSQSCRNTCHYYVTSVTLPVNNKLFLLVQFNVILVNG